MINTQHNTQHNTQYNTMSKHLNFTGIKFPRRINANEITGLIADGTTIGIRREMNGWQVNLTVRIDGVLWHNSEAAIVDRLEFDRLMERATDDEWDYTCKKNKRAFDLAEKWGLRR